MNKMVSFDEIGLIPSVLSTIDSRNEVNPFINNKLPIFVSPMTCIIDENNFDTFDYSKVIPIFPVRAETSDVLIYDDRWQALTLQTFAYYFNGDKAPKDINFHILIDCANGHMESLYSAIKDAKKSYDNLTVMIGNIANPDTYLECCRAGVDYVRVGIGGGSACITSVLTGFHSSLPWLLSEINAYKKGKEINENDSSYYDFNYWLYKIDGIETKIVADGGINNIGKAIKALALGADYVMMGKVFASCIESCGKTINAGFSKLYYGQASKQGQIDRFGKVKSEPEGTEIQVPVLYNLSEFTDKFEHILRSAMSYAGTKNLSEFIGKVQYNIQTQNEFNSYIK